jgi:hypothetical protein
MTRNKTALLVAAVGIAIACGGGDETTNIGSAALGTKGGAASLDPLTQPNRSPIGWVDNATNPTGSSLVRPNDKVVAIGWAADWEDGAAPTHVTVSVDGTVAGTTMASTSRPDVAAYFSNPAFANTGWSLELNITGLALGTHTVTAEATDSAGASAPLSGAITFSISNANQPPIGWVDNATNAAGSSTVRPNDKVVAIGWAGDWEDGARPASVSVSVDGKVAGTTTASTPRLDVAAYFANPAFANTGWSVALDISGLVLGSHTVTAVATDSSGASAPLDGSITFTISNANQPPMGWVDNATNGAGSSTVRPNGKLVAIGWAADWEDGARPTSVTVSVDDNVVGTTTASTPRPDVAAYFGNPSFANTGWSLEVDATTLGVGIHSVTAVGTDSAGATGPLSGLVSFSVEYCNDPSEPNCVTCTPTSAHEDCHTPEDDDSDGLVNHDDYLDCIDCFANPCGGGTICDGMYCVSSCTDGYKDSDESDVDCGGGCPKCANGKSCWGSYDCLSDKCVYAPGAFQGICKP